MSKKTNIHPIKKFQYLAVALTTVFAIAATVVLDHASSHETVLGASTERSTAQQAAADGMDTIINNAAKTKGIPVPNINSYIISHFIIDNLISVIKLHFAFPQK